MIEKNIGNWAYDDTVGGNAKEGCFGKLYKENQDSGFVTCYIRMISMNKQDNTNYFDFVIKEGIPNGFRPLTTFYHTVGNLNNDRNITLKINPDGSIQARLDSNTPSKINVYALITYPVK